MGKYDAVVEHPMVVFFTWISRDPLGFRLRSGVGSVSFLKVQ